MIMAVLCIQVNRFWSAGQLWGMEGEEGPVKYLLSYKKF